MLGPHLFPLIADAEQKVIGTRLLPRREGGPLLRSERYALHVSGERPEGGAMFVGETALVPRFPSSLSSASTFLGD